MAKISLRRSCRRVINAVRWRMGMTVIADALKADSDEAVSSFYSSRMTLTEFLADPKHYERPRAEWIAARVSGGTLLEVGCGDGGMTALLSPKVDSIVALDISAPSIRALQERGLRNVRTVVGLVETACLEEDFDWVVMSEVLEHVRKPALVVGRCFDWLAPGGSLLLTVPNGHWESNEHLHEFSLHRLTNILAGSGGEAISSGFIRDAGNRRRWLFGQITKPTVPAAPDGFADRRVVARQRRRGC